MVRNLVTIVDVHDIEWGLAAMPLIGLFLVTFAWKHIRNERQASVTSRPNAGDRIKARIALAFFVVWTSLLGFAAMQRNIILPRRLDTGRFEISEGPITAYVLQPWKGYGSDIFTVGQTRFNRFDYDVRSKDKTIVRKGCMAEGRWVRVSHIGQTILKIEIEADPTSTLAKCRGSRRGE